MSIKSKIFFIIIAISIVIMVGVLIYFLMNQNQNIAPDPEDTPVTTIYPTFPPPTATPPLINRSPVSSLMPVTANEYTIEYLYATDMYIVTITQSPYEENKLKAEQWFADNGVTNLNTLNILYNRYPLVE